MMKYLIAFLIAASSVYIYFSSTSTIQPLPISAFYQLAAKNAIIFDTRI